VSAFLFRLGRSCARHPFRVLGAWLLVAFALLTLNGTVGGDYNDEFRIPGADAQHAADVLHDSFPARAGVGSRFVFHTTDGRLDEGADRAVVTSAVRRLAAGHDVADVSDPFAPGAGAISRDGRTAYADVTYRVDKVDQTHLADARRVVDAARAAGVRTEFNGSLASVEQDGPSSELIGLVIAVAVLLFAFGSVIAMGLPIGTALIGIVIGLAGVGLVAGITDVPSSTQTVATMIGLGVGIDYALFVVTRHRQHLHDGMAVADAAGTANATSGQAVLFAGTTVVIAILGLVIAGLPLVTMMGVAVAIVVVAAMVAAVTLLPGLLGLAGTKIDALSVHRRHRPARSAPATADEPTFAERWAQRVGGRPVRYAVASFVALGALAVPVVSMRIAFADDGNVATSHTQRRAYDLLSAAFGPGFNGPMQVVVQMPRGGDQAAVSRVAGALRDDPGIAEVDRPIVNPAGDTALVVTNPTTSPQDEATDALVHHLRRDVLPDALAGTDAHAYVTGQAMATDVSSRITDRLPWFIAAVVAPSFVLLMAAFR
jgi:RND superfamily putative drug exporter